MSSSTPRRTRKAQLASSGLGSHFVSPRKARDKRKTQTYVELPGAEMKRRRLLDAMERLMKSQHEEPHLQLSVQAAPLDTVTMEHMDADNLVEFHSEDVDEQPSLEISVTSVKRRIIPDQPTNSLYKNWIALIPTLVDPVLRYFGRTQGKALETIHPVISACGEPSCTPKRTTMMCLFFDRFTSIDVLSCTCLTLQQVLVHHGLFPTAPSQPRMAVSVDLLSFYRALFECSCDAINALASALKNHYSWRGYQMTDAQGEVIQDPFRRGLGYAVQWYDILQVEVERQVEMVVQQHRDHIAKFQVSSRVPNSPSLTQCAPLLVQRCPACFAGILHGRSTDEGGDIHVAMDGNFHHRHRRAAGDCPNFYDPTYFLPKSFVDAIGRHIDTQRKRPVKSHVPLVPNEAKATMDSFDDTGIMALICRHDIPLFFANIDSPGEQQKYSLFTISAVFWHEHSPRCTARLKKELDTVLALQADLDTSDKALQTARTMLEKDMASDDTLEALESLERGHDRLMNKVEALYSSLNVHDRFPELHGINLEFVRILLLARDLKMNVRKRAIASFFEWDKLDEQHQAASTDTQSNFKGLMEDVWITPSLGEVPRWLDDTSIRDGIRALLKRDRCREEQVRWALRPITCEPFAVPLQQRHANFIRLQTRWSNCLASSVRFTNEVSKAVAIATTLSGGSPNMMFHWINASTLVVPDSEGGDELPIIDPDHCPQVDSEKAALADVLEGEMGALELDDDDSTNYGREVNAVICWNLPDNLLVDDFCIPLKEPDVLDPAKIFAQYDLRTMESLVYCLS
ncbi:hypothetical protein C8R48DRAFT_833650 [Suillus tomentosus]|nr:hypothetical protein C8R48DRAFT_833650 [Suillus tomentosus]